jgi:hypothetical protein
MGMSGCPPRVSIGEIKGNMQPTSVALSFTKETEQEAEKQ